MTRVLQRDAAFLSSRSMVDPATGCWIWIGGYDRDGYGRTSMGPDEPNWPAHVAAYKILVGDVPDGLVLDHLCRVRACINPAHMEPVTPIENSRRQEIRRKTHCLRGHLLSEDNLYSYSSGFRSCKACARLRGQRPRGGV